MLCAAAFVLFLLNSNRKLHSLGTAFPSTVGAVNVHWREACNARLAKYPLPPLETKAARNTAPDVSTSTFTFTVTVPLTVSLALRGTSGKTSLATAPWPTLAFVREVGKVAGCVGCKGDVALGCLVGVEAGC